MIQKFIIALIGFIVVVATLGAVKATQIQKMMGMDHSQPPAAVSTIEAKTEAWTPVIHGIGTLAPVEGVTLAAEADGALIKLNVENGASVEAGTVLMELDVSVELAQQRSLAAQLALARLNAHRANELLEKHTISQAEVDQTTAQLNQAEANLAALTATIEKKTVRAPFTGRVGIRQVNLGQFISRGQPLVSLQRLTSLFANFSLPQRQLPDLAVGQTVRVLVDAFPNRSFPARLSAISPMVDASTRNLSLQATVENADELLRPGMFVRVEVDLPTPESRIILPATSIAYAAYGNSVYIVEMMKGTDGKEYLGVRQQFVKLGATRGDMVVIEDGVKPGEKVVTAGVFKLRNAAPVQVNNIVTPTSSTAPKPANT